MLPVLDQASFLSRTVIDCYEDIRRMVDSRACAGSLQVCDAPDQSWWRRQGNCGKRDVDIDIDGIVGFAEEIVHHAVVLDVCIVDIIHGRINVCAVHDDNTPCAGWGWCLTNTDKVLFAW